MSRSAAEAQSPLLGAAADQVASKDEAKGPDHDGEKTNNNNSSGPTQEESPKFSTISANESAALSSTSTTTTPDDVQMKEEAAPQKRKREEEENEAAKKPNLEKSSGGATNDIKKQELTTKETTTEMTDEQGQKDDVSEPNQPPVANAASGSARASGNFAVKSGEVSKGASRPSTTAAPIAKFPRPLSLTEKLLRNTNNPALKRHALALAGVKTAALPAPVRAQPSVAPPNRPAPVRPDVAPSSSTAASPVVPAVVKPAAPAPKQSLQTIAALKQPASAVIAVSRSAVPRPVAAVAPKPVQQQSMQTMVAAARPVASARPLAAPKPAAVPSAATAGVMPAASASARPAPVLPKSSSTSLLTKRLFMNVSTNTPVPAPPLPPPPRPCLPGSVGDASDSQDSDPGSTTQRRASATVAAAAVPATVRSAPPLGGEDVVDESNMTLEELTKMRRERNKKHARNSRLRKKAYVDELTRKLEEIVAQRDAAEAEKQRAQQRERDERQVRYSVLEEFLKLRASNERNILRWSAILQDGFKLTLPVTRYRNMIRLVEANSIADASEQVLQGVTEVMADADCVATFLAEQYGPETSFRYRFQRDNFLMDGPRTVLEWDAFCEVPSADSATSLKMSLKGFAQGNFNPTTNQLISLTLSFDTESVARQLSDAQKAEVRRALQPQVQAPQAAAANQEGVAAPVPSVVNVISPTVSVSSSADPLSDGTMEPANCNSGAGAAQS